MTTASTPTPAAPGVSPAAAQALPASGFIPGLSAFSAGLARVEFFLAGVSVGVIFSLLVINIVTRTAGNALFWVDEAAVFAMTWMGFLAAAVGLQRRQNIAVTVLTDRLPASLQRVTALIADLAMLAFIVAFGVLVWRWLDPIGLIQAGFDLEVFSAETFNFVYEEPTQTLGVRKIWFWSILPIFSICALIHCLANLDQRLASMRHSEG